MMHHATVSALRPLRRTLAAPLVALAALFLAAPAQADTLTPVRTNLESNSERMISYRHQERMWQTADGGLHLMINRGTLKPVLGLALYSSYDGGQSWRLSFDIGNTDKGATGDGEFDGQRLSLVHAASDGSVRFLQLDYDASSRSWSSVRDEVAHFDAAEEGLNPTIATDRQGTAWVGFVSRDRTTARVNIRLLYRPAAGGWFETPQVLGPTDSDAEERSARPVRTADGMGLVFRVRERTFWAQRTDGQALDAAWQVGLLHSGTVRRTSLSDPWASHFGVVVDDQNNLHLGLIDNQDLIYLRKPADGSWSAPRAIDGERRSTYMQIGWVDGKLVVAIPAPSGAGVILVSDDRGETFVERHALAVPAATTDTNYKTSRLEMPGLASGALPLLQQFSEKRRQRLMLYRAMP